MSADVLQIVPLADPPRATIQVPGSKSITNRALVLAALTAKGHAYSLHGALHSQDTEIMIDCLRTLGFRVLTDWPDTVVCVSSHEGDAVIPAATAQLQVGNSGTTMRFLTAMVSLGRGPYRLDGAPRMRERPIEDLLAALRQLGVRAYSEKENGCPPVVVEANSRIHPKGSALPGGPVRIQGRISSQFISALMMAATQARGPVRIRVQGELVSQPYVRMTRLMIEQFGHAVVDYGPDDLEVVGLGSGNSPAKAAPFPERLEEEHVRSYQIEPDASAASYFWGAAAILGGRITVPFLQRQSLQGDVRFLDVLEEMGGVVRFDEAGASVSAGPLRGIDVDMNDISDTVMTLAAVACFADGPTTIRNVAHIRHKETDRIAALAVELRKVGAGVEEYRDGLRITPRPLHGALIETYDDHRMAMSMALIGLKVPGIVITNPACVAKTYPHFFADLEKLRSTP